jgi:3-oxoacyl-[acyl-carrier protein] reductase
MASQTAIVTGAGRGIGLKIAEALVGAGYAVVGLDRDADVVQAAKNLGALGIAADLADPEAAAGAIASALDQLGGVHLLVNNAGIFRSTPLLEITADEWDTVMAVNARTMLTTTQAVVPAMKAGGGGVIVNMASMGGKEGEPGQAHYAASKAAVIALTRVSAMELGPANIKVNCLCPGYVLTDMGAETRDPDQVAQWEARSPLGRLASTSDVAGHVTFLASDAGAYVTGQAININGGMIMY